MTLRYVLVLSLVIGLSAVNCLQHSYVDSKGVLHNLTDGQQIRSVQDWVAYAQYDNGINSTGWAQLVIEANKSFNDSFKAYSMGLVEGIVTNELIDLHFTNTIEDYCDDEQDFCDRLFEFVETNMKFTNTQIEKLAKTDPFWRQVELSLIQISGIIDGQRRATGQPLEGPRTNFIFTNITDYNKVFAMNLMTEFGDLEEVLARKVKTYHSNGHCSAIVKVVDNELFVSHNTWTSYGEMLRIMKRYDYNYENIGANSMVFSSYPGIIYSVDDFYLLSSGLTVLETTIENFNNSLWKSVVADKVVFEFLRNTVANRLAKSGREWTEVFAKYNSGTYNNQFMIVDYKKYQKGTSASNLPNDVLWILEQMPGFTNSSDVTQVLRSQQYWPSYNVPYFPSIYEISDQESMVKKYGDFFTYDKTPRALIFKRDQKNVTDVSSLYRLMRYNDFKNDPLSRCNCSPPYSAQNAIAARNDLNDPSGHYPFRDLRFASYGAIDVKIVNSELFANLEVVADSGPTYEELPPFQWSKSRIEDVSHAGQPDLFKFPPMHMKWAPPSQTVVRF